MNRFQMWNEKFRAEHTRTIMLISSEKRKRKRNKNGTISLRNGAHAKVAVTLRAIRQHGRLKSKQNTENQSRQQE